MPNSGDVFPNSGLFAGADPVAGLFGPDTGTWKHRHEQIMGLAGPAVLLLNVAHPLVAAGVHDHSHWQRNPVGRIKATAGFMETIYFGDLHEVRSAAEGLWRMHGTVTGTAPDGRPYAARDPRLLGWVWESTIWMLARARPLLLGAVTGRMDDARWQEALMLAAASGIPTAALSESFAQLERRIDVRLSQEIRVGGQARELAAALRASEESLLDESLTGLLRRATRWPAAALVRFVDLLTASLLPEPLRAGYGLSLGIGARERLAAEAEMIRQTRRILPAELRYPEAQRRAWARVRKSGTGPDVAADASTPDALG